MQVRKNQAGRTDRHIPIANIPVSFSMTRCVLNAVFLIHERFDMHSRQHIFNVLTSVALITVIQNHR